MLLVGGTAAACEQRGNRAVRTDKAIRFYVNIIPVLPPRTTPANPPLRFINHITLTSLSPLTVEPPPGRRQRSRLRRRSTVAATRRSVVYSSGTLFRYPCFILASDSSVFYSLLRARRPLALFFFRFIICVVYFY